LLCVRYTSKQSGSDTIVYATSLAWPKDGQLLLAAVSSTQQTTVTILGYQGSLEWKSGAAGGIVVDVQAIPENEIPCQWAWVFKLANLADS